MKKAENKSDKTITIPLKAYLALIAEKLKGRDLFPQRTKEIKEMWRKTKGVKIYE